MSEIHVTRQRHTTAKSNINQGLTNHYMTLLIPTILFTLLTAVVNVKTPCAK